MSITAIAATSDTDLTVDSDRTAEPSTSDGRSGSPGGGSEVSSVTLADGSEYLLVDPGELIIGANVRPKADLDKDFKGFTRDIGKRGVRAPIITRRNDAGELVVVEGQMRVLAAVKTGRPLVRVLVEPGPVSDDPASEAERIINQLGDNFHRTANSHADEVRATQQLLDLGLSARAIEQQRSIPRTRVTTLVAVARSGAAADAVTTGIADLTQAAVLAEFDGDDDAIAQLVECARTDPKRFGQVAQWLRDDREEARLCQQARDRLAEQGVTVIDRPDGLFGGRIRRLDDLRPTPKTKPGTALSAKRHDKCPGHAAYLDYWGGRPVKDRVQVVYVCTDFRQHGHAERYASTNEVATSGQRTGTMSEQEKAYRRTVIANGKAWDSATTFRRTWLKEFAARKTAPQGAQVWLAHMLAQGGPELRQAMEDDHTLAVELLGLAAKPDRTRYDRQTSHPIADAAAKATPGRATMITLVMLLAALEKQYRPPPHLGAALPRPDPPTSPSWPATTTRWPRRSSSCSPTPPPARTRCPGPNRPTAPRSPTQIRDPAPCPATPATPGRARKPRAMGPCRPPTPWWSTCRAPTPSRMAFRTGTWRPEPLLPRPCRLNRTRPRSRDDRRGRHLSSTTRKDIASRHPGTSHG